MIRKVGKKEKDKEIPKDAPETGDIPLEEENVQTAAGTCGADETAPEEAAKPDELEELKKANADLADKLLRQMAEFDNFRKRTAREKEEIGIVAKSKCISEILPVVDNFERAMQSECADGEFRKGMELIFKSLTDALTKMGVEEIKAEGEPFNPDLHYAVSTVESEELGSNVVANVLQKGYQLNGKVIRHAMVAVANP